MDWIILDYIAAGSTETSVSLYRTIRCYLVTSYLLAYLLHAAESFKI